MAKINLILRLIALLVIFISGFLINQLIKTANLENPLSIASNELPSPRDRVEEKDIYVYNDKVVLAIPNAYLARFTATKSMDPLFDIEANALEIRPSNYSQLIIGDIISYKSKISGDIIIHRIISMGYDNNGWFAIVKGDNNKYADPEKIRFEQIKGVVIALIY